MSQNYELHCANVDRLKTNYRVDERLSLTEGMDTPSDGTLLCCSVVLQLTCIDSTVSYVAVWACSWHSSGDFLATCSMDNTAKIWDLNRSDTAIVVVAACGVLHSCQHGPKKMRDVLLISLAFT